MMPSIRLIAGLTLVLQAATQAPAPGASPADSALETLIADAAGGPPEFGADLLIRIAASPAITETARKRELLETAFFRAQPAKVLGAAPVEEPYWHTADAWRLADGLARLRDAAQGRRGNAIKRSSEWQEQAQEWLLQLDLWHGAGEPVDRDYFDEKSLLYSSFLDTSPPAGLRTHAVRSLVEFLRRTDKDRDRRALWFAHVRSLLDRGDPPILDALDQSGDFVLRMYARAQRLPAAQLTESTKRSAARPVF